MLGNVVSGVVGAAVGAAAGAAAVVLSDPKKRKQVGAKMDEIVKMGEKEVKELAHSGKKAWDAGVKKAQKTWK